jgi:hypothetical protein
VRFPKFTVTISNFGVGAVHQRAAIGRDVANMMLTCLWRYLVRLDASYSASSSIPRPIFSLYQYSYCKYAESNISTQEVTIPSFASETRVSTRVHNDSFALASVHTEHTPWLHSGAHFDARADSQKPRTPEFRTDERLLFRTEEQFYAFSRSGTV